MRVSDAYMSKFEVSKRGNPTYEKFIEEFIDKFEATFPNRFSRDFLKIELLKNLKSIYKIKEGYFGVQSMYIAQDFITISIKALSMMKAILVLKIMKRSMH